MIDHEQELMHQEWQKARDTLSMRKRGLYLDRALRHARESHRLHELVTEQYYEDAGFDSGPA